MQGITEIYEIIVSQKFRAIWYYSYIDSITVYDESWVYAKNHMELYGTAIDILRNVSGISIVVTEYFMICT